MRYFLVVTLLKGFSISVITYMELVQGMRGKHELNSLKQALRLIYLPEEISAKAMFYVEQHFLLRPGACCALIGTSAISLGIPLLTGNEKHYRLSDLELLKFVPA